MTLALDGSDSKCRLDEYLFPLHLGAVGDVRRKPRCDCGPASMVARGNLCLNDVIVHVGDNVPGTIAVTILGVQIP